MIYTRFGSKIGMVHWFDEATGDVSVAIDYEDGKSRRWVGHVSNLKADGGIHEIIEAAHEKRDTANT